MHCLPFAQKTLFKLLGLKFKADRSMAPIHKKSHNRNDYKGEQKEDTFYLTDQPNKDITKKKEKKDW